MLYGTETLTGPLDFLFPRLVAVHNHRSQQDHQLSLGGNFARMAKHVADDRHIAEERCGCYIVSDKFLHQSADDHDLSVFGLDDGVCFPDGALRQRDSCAPATIVLI